MKKEINIYCDGSAIGNPGPGGWGAVIFTYQARGGQTVVEIGGFEKHTTNNRMELTATIEALKKAKGGEVTIKTDSQYVINGITKWVYGWQKNGWKTAQKGDVLNKDLWQMLMKEVEKSEVTFTHVKGHAGEIYNERVDTIANIFARGKKVNLYQGADRDYKEMLSKEPKKTTTKTGKAYSYVSLVEGKVMVHKTWDECKNRVDGKKASFKKVLSKEEEETLIQKWHVKM